MKLSFKNIQNQIKKFFSFKKINPHNHWRKLLTIFLVLIFILIIFSFYLLYRIKNQKIFQIEPKSDKSAVLINEKLLEKINDSFDQKETKTKEIKDGLKSFKDPSIN